MDPERRLDFLAERAAIATRSLLTGSDKHQQRSLPAVASESCSSLVERADGREIEGSEGAHGEESVQDGALLASPLSPGATLHGLCSTLNVRFLTLDADIPGSSEGSNLASMLTMAATIKNSGASVGACCRMGSRKGLGLTMLKQLAEESGLSSYSFCAALEGGGEHGVGILSAWPILEERTLWCRPRKPDHTSLHHWCAGTVTEPR